MKFLIATGIYPPEIGGPSTVMSSLASELTAAGHDVIVVTYGDGVSEERIVRVSKRGDVGARYWRFASALKRYLEPDRVVVATDVFSVGIPVRFALIGKPNPLFIRLGGEWMWEDAVTNGGLRVTLRDYWAHHAEGFRHRMKRSLAAWVLDRAKTVAVTSDILRVPLRHISPSLDARVVTVPNVATRTDCVPAPHVADGELRVLYSGRFAPVKNLPFFCRALKLAREQGANISMVFVGDGEERAACERILSGVTHVRFVGTKAPHDVQNLLAEADLYVLPSLSDICPNGVLEALGCGIPCLVTAEHGLPPDVGGMMELNPTDEHAWADALVRLSSDASVLDELRKRIHLPPSSGVTLFSVVTTFLQAR